MQYMEVPTPDGDGRCSDNRCPCSSPNDHIPRGKGYIYVSEQVADFRRDCPTVAQARDKVEAARSGFDSEFGGRGFTVFTSNTSFVPVLMCGVGARLRSLNLDIAADDAAHWWKTGLVPIRPTPLADASSDSATSAIEAELAAEFGDHQPPQLPGTSRNPSARSDIRFQCTHCGHRMRAARQLAGKKFRCNACQAITRAPDKSETTPKTKPRSKQSVSEICCQHCSTVQRVPKRLARRKVRCRGCGQSLAGSPDAASPEAHSQQPAVPPPLPPASATPPSASLRFDGTPSRNDDCIAALDSRHRGLAIVREALVERMVRSTGFSAEKAAIMTAAPMALMLMRGSMEYEMLLAAAVAMGERATAHRLTSASRQVAGVPDSWNGPAWAIQFE